jgi:hypothetical protein
MVFPFPIMLFRTNFPDQILGGKIVDCQPAGTPLHSAGSNLLNFTPNSSFSRRNMLH